VNGAAIRRRGRRETRSVQKPTFTEHAGALHEERHLTHMPVERAFCAGVSSEGEEPRRPPRCTRESRTGPLLTAVRATSGWRP
jgi:hypothetical protein